MRLDKFLCKSTELTKPDASQVIAAGEVLVNGEVVTSVAKQVHENNCVTWRGQPLTPRPFRYILFHKPADVLCSNVDGVYPSLFNALTLDKKEELHIAGRLDADTTGMVLITDDGRWSFNLTRPESGCKKVYRVGLSRPLAEGVAQKFEQGIQLQGETELTLPAYLEVMTSTDVRLTMTQGKFHQVKRMFSAVGNRVVRLHREAIGGVSLDLDEGEWRYLLADEIKRISPVC